MMKRGASPHFSHQVVAKRRKGRPDKARDPQAGTPGPRKRTREHVEEADRVERWQGGWFRRCSREFMHSAG